MSDASTAASSIGRAIRSTDVRQSPSSVDIANRHYAWTQATGMMLAARFVSGAFVFCAMAHCCVCIKHELTGSYHGEPLAQCAKCEAWCHPACMVQNGTPAICYDCGMAAGTCCHVCSATTEGDGTLVECSLCRRTVHQGCCETSNPHVRGICVYCFEPNFRDVNLTCSGSHEGPCTVTWEAGRLRCTVQGGTFVHPKEGFRATLSRLDIPERVRGFADPGFLCTVHHPRHHGGPARDWHF